MKKWLLYELRGFYVVIALGMVGFSLLTYLPSDVSVNDITHQGGLWGMAAFMCFAMVIFTFLLETVVDVLRKKRKK